MRVYLVGGAVRDKLLGKQSNDNDYVVVGSTVEEMLSKGFAQVGKDFPVFLHPDTGDEYALARTERKSGVKHTDFQFDFNSSVTLEEDILRRDFTCNALAIDEIGNVIDYVNGQEDIKSKVLRAVRPETFVEDPLRVLRGARFSAQLGFTIEPSTMKLFKQMVSDGMLNHLTPERVWKETEKALTQGYDSVKYFEILKECGALEVLFPEIYALTKVPEIEVWHPSGNSFKHTMIALQRAQSLSNIEKFAVICHDLGKGNTPVDVLPHHYGHENRGGELIETLCERLKAPNDYKKFAKIFCKNHMRFYKVLTMKAHKQFALTKELSDKFTSYNLLMQYINCFKCDYFGENLTYNDKVINDYDSIVSKLSNIYHTMEGIGLDDLSDKTKQKLAKLSGEKFGEVYNQALVQYMLGHL